MLTNTGYKIFMASVACVVVVVLAIGLWISGSPSAERARSLDSKRLQDLQGIANAVDNYFNMSGTRLPPNLATLSALRDSYYVASIVDPDTGLAYEYLIDATSTYQLCATFETNTVGQSQDPQNPYPYYTSTFWEHPIGRTCYSITARTYPK